MTLESLEHVLLWVPVNFIHRLAPTPLLIVTGADDQVHAIDEALRAYDRAWEPKRLELLQVDEFGLSIEPGLGQSMNLAAEFFDQHLRQTPGSCHPRPPTKRGLGACDRNTGTRRETRSHEKEAHCGRPLVPIIPVKRDHSASTDPAAFPVPDSGRRATAPPNPLSDEIWNAAANHFDERQLSAIVLMIAFTNCANRINATIQHSIEG